MPDITKPTTIKDFFKENTTLRVGNDAITSMLTNINRVSLDILKKAEAICQSENRTTLLDRDINQAFQTIGGGIDNTPEGLFKAIETMDAETIGKISLLIAKWVQEHRKELES